MNQALRHSDAAPQAAAEPPISREHRVCEHVAQLVATWRAIDGCSAALGATFDRIASRRRLNQTQLLALYTCWEARPDGVHQSQLAVRIGVSPPQASALVEQLRQQTLLTPQRSASDRRRQLWSLTAAGTETIESLLDELANCAALVITALSEHRAANIVTHRTADYSAAHPLTTQLIALTTALHSNPQTVDRTSSVPRLRVVGATSADDDNANAEKLR